MTTDSFPESMLTHEERWAKDREVIETDDAVEELMTIYEVVRREKISGYRLSRNNTRYKPLFKSLLAQLTKYEIDPVDYMMFALRTYTPHPYINMVCSKRAVALYLAQGKPTQNFATDLEAEIRIFKDKETEGYPVRLLANQLVGAIRSLTLYFLVKARDGEPTEETVNKAYTQWIFCNEKNKELYKQKFPNIEEPARPW